MHNLTNQVIPEREKWLYIARLRAVLALIDAHSDRWSLPANVRIVVDRRFSDHAPVTVDYDFTL